MDIKGLARTILPLPGLNPAKATENSAAARAKTESSGDREGNGQQAAPEPEKKKLSAEELEDAMKYLEALPGVKENGLSVKLMDQDGIVVVYIKDRDGKVVRRIPEAELWALTRNRDRKSGHLLNKAL